MNPIVRHLLQVVLVVAVLGVALGGGAALMAMAPKPVVKEPEPVPPPLVDVLVAHDRPLTLDVVTQGTVVPAQESSLVAQVAGTITWVSPELANGRFVAKDAPLVQIDRSDYDMAVANAGLTLAQAKRALAQEQAEQAVAIREWRRINGASVEIPPLVGREPQIAEAEARVAAAEAGLAKAGRDLARTEVKAPYAGRISGKHVDLGQFVGVGTPLASLYATDALEVRLPLTVRELGDLDLPLDVPEPLNTSEEMVGTADGRGGPGVALTTRTGRDLWRFAGRIVRVEGELDANTRVVYAVARVDQPFAPDPDQPGRKPLMPGQFAEATIRGLDAHGVEIPRSVLHGHDTVWIATTDDTLEFRTVDVLRMTASAAVISSGLEDGERVITSALATPVEGMRLRVGSETDSREVTGTAVGDGSREEHAR